MQKTLYLHQAESYRYLENTFDRTPDPQTVLGDVIYLNKKKEDHLEITVKLQKKRWIKTFKIRIGHFFLRNSVVHRIRETFLPSFLVFYWLLTFLWASNLRQHFA